MKKFFALMICLLIITAQASAMNLTLNKSIGLISLNYGQNELQIKGYTHLDGNFSKGVAQFGNLYFHFDATSLNYVTRATNFEEEQKIFDAASRFGSRDFANTVPVYTFEGSTQISPISSDDDREFYLLATETGGGGSMKVIGSRGGKWVKFFDTLDLKQSKQIGWDWYLQNLYTDGDKIIFVYEDWQNKKLCTVIYKWDESAQWFGVEIVR